MSNDPSLNERIAELTARGNCHDPEHVHNAALMDAGRLYFGPNVLTRADMDKMSAEIMAFRPRRLRGYFGGSALREGYHHMMQKMQNNYP